MNAFGKENFEEAAKHFRNSVGFFEKNAWVDRWRNLVLLTPVVPTYREMGLFNIANCLLLLGRTEEGYQQLTAARSEYPKSALLANQLELLDTLRAGVAEDGPPSHPPS